MCAKICGGLATKSSFGFVAKAKTTKIHCYVLSFTDRANQTRCDRSMTFST
jgi:hypothetical protein